MDMLYLCDGYACDEHHKKYCYMYGGGCCHTPHAEHSLSKITPDFPPTKFVPLRAGTIVVEQLDEQGIFAEMRKGKELKLIESE